MWALIAQLPEPKDYLQVFRLSVSDKGTQRIVHEQEEPQYHKEYDIDIENPITAKVYVIDDNDHGTMLLAEEYAQLMDAIRDPLEKYVGEFSDLFANRW